MTKVTRFSRRKSPESLVDPILGPRCGTLVCVDADGRPWVDFSGNPSGPLPAKLAMSDLDLSRLVGSGNGSEVLLLFEDNDVARPIVVGMVRERIPADGIAISVRGRWFTLEMEEEVELRCGDAKLRITRDGKVVVLGNDVVSRARGRHRIKGGTVNIN